MIAFLSQHDAGDQTVITNTLDKFLGPDAPYTLDFDETGTAYGSALGTEFHLNPKFIGDGNGRVNDANSDTLHMTTHTFAHEVNHLVNGDKVAQSAKYLNAEYRAFYVGFKAENGRDPTAAEVLDRVRFLLTASSGAYGEIAKALQAGNGESDQIVDFMKDLLGRDDVTAANAATLAPADPNAPATVPQGDLDN